MMAPCRPAGGGVDVPAALSTRLAQPDDGQRVGLHAIHAAELACSQGRRTVDLSTITPTIGRRMVVVEILGGIVFLALAGATTAMALVGGLGLLGVVTLEQCPECMRLAVRPKVPGDPRPRCPHQARVHRLHPQQSFHAGYRRQAA